MVDDFTPVRLLPLAEVCPERCNLFGLLGNFQRCLQCGSDKFPNKLRHFPLANIRVAASIRFLHLQPSFFRWMHHPPCGLDLLLLLYRLYRLGQGLTAQVVVQVFVSVIVVEKSLIRPANSPASSQYAFRPASSLSSRQCMRSYPCSTSMAFETLETELRMT